MHPMQGTPGENESSASELPDESERELVKASPDFLGWAVAIAYGIYIYRKFFNDEEMQLQTLHLLIRIFQSIARLFGRMALHAEHNYNEYAETLH